MAAPGQHNVDIDALLDLTEYDGVSNYNSPSLSPSAASKPTFASPVAAAVTTPSVPSSTQTLSGPSHNYDMYRQQTGFVPGAIANTMAVNQTNNTGYQDFGNLDYLSSFSPEDDLFDFNTSPSQNTMGPSDMDVDFGSPIDSQHFLSTVNPSSIEQDGGNFHSPTVAASRTGSVGRLWPGAHSQAAMAKAQQQQVHRQHAMQQQKPQGKIQPPSDPLVEQKITQLLNSMRARTSEPDSQSSSSPGNLPRAKKEEEEMDEDERLLASEEGKKLSSKERRQLRNKVSARAFRSRRKGKTCPALLGVSSRLMLIFVYAEYISQLELEIANKVNENGDLRAQNRALADENRRLSDLTRMLLSSPSFSNFLDHLSSNSSALPQPGQIKPEPQQQEQRPAPKDVNPHQHPQQQQISMAMIPEQTLDFSMLNLGNASYNFQPQVFLVDTLDVPRAIDVSLLSGKTSNLGEAFDSGNDKVEAPSIERPVEELESSGIAEAWPTDAEFESNPDFALFHAEPSTADNPERTPADDCPGENLFGEIEPEKALARFELTCATEEEASATMAMTRVLRISASIEPVVSRLERLTFRM